MSPSQALSAAAGASLITLIFLATGASAGINCYDCDSSKNFTCTEFWDSNFVETSDYLSDCSNVFDANYCVKMAGVFDGKLGTKRFCSSKDWGNYCEYIKRPGDIQEYRSCVFTCGTNECNGAQGRKAGLSILAVLVVAATFLRRAV